jgi:diguanylate cyclase (GGDEF)-like protein
MAPARTARTEQLRLTTLLEIGRSLSGATDALELRLSVLSGLSKLFEADRLFYADVDAAWHARVVAVATHGQARRADPTYPAISTAATSDDGCALDAEAARVLADTIGGSGTAAGALVVPVRVNGDVVGELGAVRFDRIPYTSEDCDLLAFGAAIIAAALGQRQRVDETETRRREAERLEEIGRAITSSLELDEVLRRVLDAALDLTGADACTVWRRDVDRSIVVASRGADAPPPGTTVEGAPRLHTELLERRRSIHIADIASDGRLPADLRARYAGDGARSAVLVPMVTQSEVVGVLSLNHHAPQPYGPEAMRILERLALQAAIAVDNAKLHAEIRELSLTDPLTGLPNRRHMEMVLNKEFEAARRGRTLAVVLLDLDDFKRYNDAHGHAGGDAVLRDFASVLSGETRAMNLVVRYGGDEFLTILSESTLDGALHLVERIMEKVRVHPRLAGVSFSAGAAEYSREMESAQALIDAADAAMYRDKLTARPRA